MGLRSRVLRRSGPLVVAPIGVAVVVAVAVASSAAFPACSADLSSCGEYPHVGCAGYGAGGSSSTASSSGRSSSSTASTAASSSSSGTGGQPPNCALDPMQDPSVVSDACGVFVSATAASGGDGTRKKPLSTLSAGFAAAKTSGKHLFVCAEAYAEPTTIRFNAAVALYGNLTGCAHAADAWSMGDPKTTRATLTGPVQEVALVLEAPAASGAIDLYALDVVAPNATLPSGSSIAVFVNGGTANLTSCDVTAGDGMPGKDGTSAPTTPAPSGSNGTNGNPACSASVVMGGGVTLNACAPTQSTGGDGGEGQTLTGFAGGVGTPPLGGGKPGNGDDGSPGWTCLDNGGLGTQGADGKLGMDGPGGTGFGSLDTTGFVGDDGTDGGDGGTGQGGGGGGGVHGSAAICPAGTSGGASGGGGGSGGCGGEGGKGGKAGGASIAFVSANATVTLVSVLLKAGGGGNGGKGGNPQSGGGRSSGGMGGNGLGTLPPACNGGAGGAGGPGGIGGGGRGGHSIGIASSGVAPTYDPGSVTIGVAGAGGAGGENDVDMNGGTPGEEAVCFDFVNGVPCQ